MNRRGFIGKLLALLGGGVVAPKVLAKQEPPKFRLEDAMRMVTHLQEESCSTRRYLMPTAEVPAFVKKALGGFDPHGEPNAFTVHYAMGRRLIDGQWSENAEPIRQEIPAGHFSHCPLRHPEYPWMFATKMRKINGPMTWRMWLSPKCFITNLDGRDLDELATEIEVTFAPLPFDISHLPPYPEA